MQQQEQRPPTRHTAHSPAHTPPAGQAYQLLQLFMSKCIPTRVYVIIREILLTFTTGPNRLSPRASARLVGRPPDSVYMYYMYMYCLAAPVVPPYTLLLYGLCPRYAYVAVCSRSGPLTVSGAQA